jgi:hypothetical protein
MAIAGGIGLTADLDPLVEERGCSGETALFGEGPGGFVVAAPGHVLEGLRASADSAGIGLLEIGQIAGVQVTLSAGEVDLSVPIGDAELAWRSLGERMGEAIAA